MKNLKNILSSHTILVLYCIVFSLLLNGVIASSGFKYINEMFLFIGALILSYGIFYFISEKINFRFNKFQFLEKIQLGESAIIVLFITSLTFIIIHFIYLGGSPAIDSFNYSLVSEVAGIRRSITADSHKLINYMASFNLKAIIPFSLLLLLIKEKKVLYWILYIIACFYAFSLMQKSYIITLSIPIVIYAFAKRKFLLLSKYIVVIGFTIVSLVYVANPQFRGGKNDTTSVVEDNAVLSESEPPTYLGRVFKGLKKRIMIVPGKTVTDWFESIPSKKPYLYGTGYRFYAKLTGKEYHNYAQDLYPILYPKHVERGFHGNVNVASFMYDYSNFGNTGLILGGIILAFIFVLIEILFKGNLLLKLCLNSFPILILSSSALTILLFSGGWGLTILLYFLFKKQIHNTYA